ncbi:MAG: hypothetical protein WCA92_05060, partial [Terriglobales bacterium]
VCVSVQDERTAQQAAQYPTQLDGAATSAKADEKQPHPNVRKAEGDTPRWYRLSSRFFRWPDGPTAWVVILTLIAVAEQAQESAKATHAMRRSTDLQQSQLAQWVTIEDWSGGEDIWLHDAEKVLHNLMFVFYIVNPTNYPMSLSRADWIIDKQKDGIAINEATFPPRGKHSTVMEYQLTPEEFEIYSNGKLRNFEVEGSITFVDVSKVERTQHFAVTLNCAFEKGVVGFKPYKTSGWEANRANKKVWEKKTEP